MKNKKNKIILVIATLVMVVSLFFGAMWLIPTKGEKASATPTSFSLYLEGNNDYTTNKTGTVSMKLKLNNPSRAPIFGAQCKIYYDNTCLTFDNGTLSLAGWSGSARYNTRGYINVAFKGGSSADQYEDAVITIATLNFNVNTPTATTYPFTFPQDSISVTGIDLTTGAIEHNVTGETFNLTFRAPSADKTLKNGISVKVGGAEIGSYNASTKTYTGTVPFNTTSVSIEAAPNDSNATISGVGNWSNLQAGKEQSKTITVTAEDGTTETYTVKITREAGKDISTIGTVTLKDASNNNIALTQNGTKFTANIDSTIMTGLVLSATAQDSDAIVTINGKNPTNYALTLKAGLNTIPIKVTAQNGTSFTDYTVEITVNYIASSDASIKGNLSVKAGTVEVGVFDANNKTYNGSVDFSVSSVTITIVANDPKATVNGAGVWALNIGENKKEVTITAEDGITKSTFTVTITRAAEVIEVELGLKSLTVTTESGNNLQLNKNGNDYFIQISESEANGLTLIVEAEDANAIIKINGQNISTLPLTLSKGKNVYTIKVSDVDEIKNATYTLTITVQDGIEPGPVDPSDPDYIEIMKYITFGGDLNLTLTKYDFEDLYQDSQLTVIKTNKDNISFYLEFKSDLTVTAVYGFKDSGEVRKLQNGYTRIYFTSKNVDSLQIKITDNKTNISRTYMIDIERQDTSTNVISILLICLLIVEIVFIVIMLVKLRKLKKIVEQENNERK